MRDVIILDKEQAYAQALSRFLQSSFSTVAWHPMTSLKELYRFIDSRENKPFALLYNSTHFPDWKPTWDCHSLVLREKPLYEEIFHTSLPSALKVQKINDSQSMAVYRLDSPKIEKRMRELLSRTQELKNRLEMQSGRIYILVSDLSSRSLSKYLDLMFASNAEKGLRTFILPFGKPQTLNLALTQLSLMSDGADLFSLLRRLCHELLKPEQILAYLNPTAITGVMSFVPSSVDWEKGAIPTAALRHLISLLKKQIRKNENKDSVLILCSKRQLGLIKQLLPACDELFLLNNAAALRSPAAYRDSERIKSFVPPAFPITEHCVNDETPEASLRSPRRIFTERSFINPDG